MVEFPNHIDNVMRLVVRLGAEVTDARMVGLAELLQRSVVILTHDVSQVPHGVDEFVSF